MADQKIRLPEGLMSSLIVETKINKNTGKPTLTLYSYKVSMFDLDKYNNPYWDSSLKEYRVSGTITGQDTVYTPYIIFDGTPCEKLRWKEGKSSTLVIKDGFYVSDGSLRAVTPNVQTESGDVYQYINRKLKELGVNCEVEAPFECFIPPAIDELLKQNDKEHFVIVKAKPSLHHSLYLFNANLEDIVYSKEGDAKSNIVALKNVPRYNVFECKWQPAGKATFRFSDCSDDLCESKNAIIANGLDPLIKSKIGKLSAGNENQFLSQKFPTCCSSFDKDSTLAPQIKDELDKYKKTFYLLGMKEGEKEPKLYLFDLGQVQGGLKYSHILQAVVLKNVNCKWEEDSPLRQNLKFSELKGEVDTNFYLLTPEKLEQPSTITTITLRKANEYLLKYIPVCSTKKPEGGSNPNDNLKPDFGNGGNGGIGGSGGEGFFPDVNRPLPNPEIPPCSGQDGGSQTPVSEIYLISVPELSPSYDDTYDFAHATDQVSFFKSKRHYKVINYSYLRKESAIQVGSHVDNLKCYNYLMYKNKAGKWYYCFIMDKQYINERTARIVIATDVIQTYMFDYVLDLCYVERCHVNRWNADGTPTDEFEPEGLDFGEPIQDTWETLNNYSFKNTIVAVCSNPLGVVPSRSIKPKEKGVDENAFS